MNFKSISNFFVSILICSIFFSCANDSSSSTNSNTTSSNSTNSNSENNTTKTKVNLVTDFPGGTVFFEGANNFGNWTNSEFIKIESSIFREFQEGDSIQITHEGSSTYTEYTSLWLSPAWKDWTKDTFTKGTGINCSPNTKGLNPFTPNQTTAYTFSAAEIESMKSNALVIWGCGLTIKKITFCCKRPVKLSLVGFHYKTDYTVTYSDSNNNLTNEPLYLEFGFYDYEHNTSLMGFRVKSNDLIIGSENKSWIQVYGDTKFSETERSGTITLTDSTNGGSAMITNNIGSGSHTIPSELFNQEFSFTYSGDYKTFTIKNTAANKEYVFNLASNW